MTKRHHGGVKKFDRLLSPSATAAEIRCDYATAPYDRAAWDMDRKWGVDALPGLVDPHMAERFGRAVGHLNDCLNRHAPEEAAAAAVNCVKGLTAMDAAATAAGHKPASPDMWQIEFGGRALVFIRQSEMWPAAQEANPGATIYTLQEAAHALSQCNLPLVSAVKGAFPGAEISGVRKRTELEDALEDEIPF